MHGSGHLVEHDLHNTELGLHLRLFGLLAGGSDKTEGEKWTASEAGKDQGASQLAVVASLPLPPWSFFRSEITRSVQGVATRCFDSAACPGDSHMQFQGTRARQRVSDPLCRPRRSGDYCGMTTRAMLEPMCRTFYDNL